MPIAPAGLVLCLLIGLARSSWGAEESWPAALAKMPLGGRIPQLAWSNSINVLLPALQSNAVVKALIFLPGATDEFYLARRAKADLTNPSPTLLDAVRALTNQTAICATFRPPLLLLHTDRDRLEPELIVQHQPTADKLKQTRLRQHLVCIDRDWDYLAPLLWKALKVDVRPGWRSPDSAHFYRPSFAGWDLDGLEAVEAVCLAAKTRATILRKQVSFQLEGPPKP